MENKRIYVNIPECSLTKFTLDQVTLDQVTLEKKPQRF